jgi:hypothetical protein
MTKEKSMNSMAQGLQLTAKGYLKKRLAETYNWKQSSARV